MRRFVFINILKAVIMDYNLHTHTFRCHHAEGDCEEYVLSAIENKYKTLGFSEHIPLKFADGTESLYRMYVQDVSGYISEVLRLKEKYKGVIDIKLGFEIEYYPEYFNLMLSNAIKWGAEYLILGQHFLGPEHPRETSVYTYAPRNDVAILEKFVLTIIEGMKTGNITYVAHPDLINFTGDKNTFQKAIRPICVSARELGVPLEINFLGIREKRAYPNEWFWEIAGEERSPVTFGCDAHRPVDVFNEHALKEAKDIVNRYGLNYIGKPKLKLIK